MKRTKYFLKTPIQLNHSFLIILIKMLNKEDNKGTGGHNRGSSCIDPRRKNSEEANSQLLSEEDLRLAMSDLAAIVSVESESIQDTPDFSQLERCISSAMVDEGDRGLEPPEEEAKR